MNTLEEDEERFEITNDAFYSGTCLIRSARFVYSTRFTRNSSGIFTLEDIGTRFSGFLLVRKGKQETVNAG